MEWSQIINSLTQLFLKYQFQILIFIDDLYTGFNNDESLALVLKVIGEISEKQVKKFNIIYLKFATNCLSV